MPVLTSCAYKLVEAAVLLNEGAVARQCALKKGNAAKS